MNYWITDKHATEFSSYRSALVAAKAASMKTIESVNVFRHDPLDLMAVVRRGTAYFERELLVTDATT